MYLFIWWEREDYRWSFFCFFDIKNIFYVFFDGSVQILLLRQAFQDVSVPFYYFFAFLMILIFIKFFPFIFFSNKLKLFGNYINFFHIFYFSLIYSHFIMISISDINILGLISQCLDHTSMIIIDKGIISWTYLFKFLIRLVK